MPSPPPPPLRRRPITSPSKPPQNPPPQPPPPPPSSSALPPLHTWDDLPAWRRDNIYIRRGYRSQRESLPHAARSLLYLHNESVNIWSHLLGALTAVAVAACVPLYHYYYYRHHSRRHHDEDVVVGGRLEEEEKYGGGGGGGGGGGEGLGPARADVVVFACFFAGAVVCLGASAAFHALLDHSERVARWGNKLDYTGIVALIVGSYVPALYYGFSWCEPGLFRLHMWVIGLLGLASAIASWVDGFRAPAWRPYRAALFVALGLSGVVPLAHGVGSHGYRYFDERMGLSWVIVQGLLYIFGALLYAARFPERFSPGKFDIWGSSHQLFHCLVLLAAATHFYAMTRAYAYHHSGRGPQCSL